MGDRREVPLPNELWLQILKGVPRSSLKNISVLNHQLRDLVFPELFAHFVFHPYCLRDDRPALPPPDVVIAATERLEFWVSHRVAPLVRSCVISSSRDEVDGAGDGDAMDIDIDGASDVFALQSALFSHLERFENLIALAAARIHFTPADLDTLTRIHGVRRFAVYNCVLPAIHDPEHAHTRKVRVRAFHFEAEPEQSAEQLNVWLSLLEPTYLRRVRLDREVQKFRAEDAERLLFPSVVDLTAVWDLDLGDTRSNEELLSLFPKVKRLILSLPDNYEDLAPADWFPFLATNRAFAALEELTAPTDLVEVFLRHPLTKINRLTIDPAPYPEQVLDIFVTLPETYTSLRWLTLSTGFMGVGEFSTLIATLPRLSHLRLEIWPDVDDEYAADLMPSGFVNGLLSAPLPATLSHMAITVFIGFASESQPAPAPVPLDPPAIFQAIYERCPELTFLWLDGGGGQQEFLIYWRRLGLAREECTSVVVERAAAPEPDIDDGEFVAKFKIRCPYEELQEFRKILDVIWPNK